MPKQPDGSSCGIFNSHYITTIYQNRAAIFSGENIKNHFQLLTLDSTFKKTKEDIKLWRQVTGIMVDRILQNKDQDLVFGDLIISHPGDVGFCNKWEMTAYEHTIPGIVLRPKKRIQQITLPPPKPKMK